MRAMVFLIILLTTGVANAKAASLESADAAKKMTDQIMAKVAVGYIEGGIMLMKPYIIIPESEFNVMLEQTLQGRFGKIVGG